MEDECGGNCATYAKSAGPVRAIEEHKEVGPVEASTWTNDRAMSSKTATSTKSGVKRTTIEICSAKSARVHLKSPNACKRHKALLPPAVAQMQTLPPDAVAIWRPRANDGNRRLCSVMDFLSMPPSGGTTLAVVIISSAFASLTAGLRIRMPPPANHVEP
jgi:hypothetical protein